MIIRPLTTLDECRQVAALEKTVWGYTDAEDVVPPPVLIVSIKRGGILLGAFDDGGAMQGFVYSMPGIEGRPADAVVAHARRDAGGARRRARRAAEAGAARGGAGDGHRSDRVDVRSAAGAERPPQLRASSASVVEEYEENVYGESSSPLHRGTPTDRFVAEWRHRDAARRAPHRGGRPAGGARQPVCWRAGRQSRRCEVDVGCGPGPADLALDEPRRAGRDSHRLRRDADAATRSWPSSGACRTREIFQTLLRARLPGRGLPLAREAGRGQYLLARADRCQTAAIGLSAGRTGSWGQRTG